jgi:dihydrofolate synthase / folylpolyglutamate synthase
MRTSDELLAELKTLHPRRMDLSLGRIEALLAKLGNPHNRLPPVIHVAGTNGKGSTAALIKAMLQAAGRRVHVYTSPHLVHFHERIELAQADGKARAIGEAELVALLERASRANTGAPVTFFEVTTAAAFLAFAEHPADALILEVGLGGRLDATNVVAHPALAVITPIALDHTDWLGDSISLIAAEKAGILKPGVPAVISRQPGQALAVIRSRAGKVKAPLTVWGEDFEAFSQRGRLVYQNAERLLDLPLPALIGHHQLTNAGTAIAAALQLKVLDITDAAIERGLVEVRWPARMQRLDGGPLSQLLAPGSELWLDGAHNPAGAQAIAQTLAELEERAPKPVGLIVGMMGKKDAAGFFAHFRGLVRRVVTVPNPGSPEATHEPTALAKVAVSAGLTADAAPDLETALARLQRLESGPLRLLICGSLYLAGQVLALHEGVQAQMN